MKLKDVDSLFGTPMPLIKTYSSRYRLAVMLCLILDIILVFIAGLMLYKSGDPSTLIQLSIIIAIVINVVLVSTTKSEYMEAFIFYLKYKNRKVELRRYSVDADKLFSVIFSAGYKRVKAERSFDSYKEALNSACLQKRKYSKRIFKNLEKYASEDGNLSVWVLTSGYYVSVNDEEVEK